MRSVFFLLTVVGLFLVAVPQRTQSQVMYLEGQSVHPSFEGYDDHRDGSYTMWFGYMNRNYEEQPHIPIGPDNFFSVVDAGATLEQITQLVEGEEGWRASGMIDRGQPTHFYTRRQKFVFGVTVPADLGERWLVWTLRRKDEVLTAIGKLRPDWVWHVNPYIWRGIVDPESSNQPPAVEVVGEDRVTVAVGESVVLTVSVRDDGLPEVPEGEMEQSAMRPLGLAPLANDLPTNIYRSTVFAPALSPGAARETGMAVTWLHYRGPSGVTFAPTVVPLDNAGGRATTTARFPEAGTYEVRAYADDGLYTGLKFAGVTVVVEERR